MKRSDIISICILALLIMIAVSVLAAVQNTWRQNRIMAGVALLKKCVQMYYESNSQVPRSSDQLVLGLDDIDKTLATDVLANKFGDMYSIQAASNTVHITGYSERRLLLGAVSFSDRIDLEPLKDRSGSDVKE